VYAVLLSAARSHRIIANGLTPTGRQQGAGAMASDVGEDIVRIADVRLRSEDYPRKRQDDDAVALYRLALGNLPPIVVTQDGFLVDGYHRYLAHVAEGKQEIAAEVVNIPETGVYLEAVRRNATHGRQLTKAEKRDAARRLFAQVAMSELCELLSVSQRTVEGWTADIRAAEDEKRDERIWQAWLACQSTPEIAEREGIAQSTVMVAIEKRKAAEIVSGAPPHLQLYDVWSFNNNAPEYGIDGYPGRIPGQVVENLLWYYTEVGDVVLDPMAGGGTTIDVCKAMGRRYLAYDLRPVRTDIQPGDATQPLALPASLTQAHIKPRLAFLDPPYWKQKRGEYEAGGLADDDLPTFYKRLQSVIGNCADVMQAGGYLAIIIGPTQEAQHVTDHALDMARRVTLPVARRFIVPYTTQQHGGAYVEFAKQNRYPLYLYRDVIVWQNVASEHEKR
jgi:hypothetical protein